MLARRRRPFRPTPRILAFALVDVFGLVLFATGINWFVHHKALFLAGFPANRAEASIAVLAGIALMLYGAARILREMLKQVPPGESDAS